MKAELKWHPVSEKPKGDFVYVVVLVAEGYIYYEASYEEDEFQYWKDEGYAGSWWGKIEEEIVGWMYEKDLTEYLKSLQIKPSE